MAEVRMPKMGDGMEEGTINSWLKKEGEHVNSGEPLAEVETDKANVEISAYESGVLTKIIVQVGQTVPIGEIIAVIGDAAAPTAAANGSASSKPQTAPEKKSANTTEKTSEKTSATSTVSANGNAPATAASQTENHSVPTAERIKISPLARRMASEMKIDVARVSGTGPAGRIVERDIKAFSDQQPAGTQSAVAAAPEPSRVMPTVETPAAPGRITPSVPSGPTAAGGQDIKPSKMREAIARRTVQSKQNIPHFYVTMAIEMDRALALLKELNADGASKVTVNDLIVKSCAVALGRVPEVNATWTAEGIIHRYAEAHIGVAVGIEEGLIIPVVRDCQTKTLRQISEEAKQLIGKARNGQLKPEDYSGGTFSVSNLGMMGVDEFIAIINPPEAAILAIGGINREPVFAPDGDAMTIRSKMKVSLSADHRLLDGVIAARFLQEVKKSLESPFSLLS